jgi:hypothetical protein
MQVAFNCALTICSENIFAEHLLSTSFSAFNLVYDRINKRQTKTAMSLFVGGIKLKHIFIQFILSIIERASGLPQRAPVFRAFEASYFNAEF